MTMKIEDGEFVPMTSEEIAAFDTVEPAAQSGLLTIRIFRSRFADTDDDLDLYDALDAAMEAERSRLVKQQWRDPGAEIVENGALYNAIAGHLTGLTTAERKAALLAAPGSA